MNINSYIKTILNAFSSMDIADLRKHLKEEYSYEDTTKKIFLDEIDRFFRRRKNANDSKLIIYEGKCRDDTCFNCDKRGYRFVGNRSRNYIDLVFVTKKDDIINIFSCKDFKTTTKIEDIGIKANIDINSDERNSFNKTPEYWAKVNAATTAWNEIITSPPRLINFDDLTHWVDKHSVTDELIGTYDSFNPVMKWTPFSMIYSELKEIRDYLAQNIDEIITANLLINNINTEAELIEWLLKYEEIGQGAPFYLKHTFHKEEDHYWWNYKNPIHFKDITFSQALDFLEYYQKHYKTIFDKYTTYTDEEISLSYNMCDSKEETKNLYSLRFHLENRKNLEAMGVHVPLYIDRNYDNT
jgi:hypothetical protein